MKIRRSSFVIRLSRRPVAPKRSEGGSVVKADHSSSDRGMITLIFIALLAIMMILVMVESSSLVRLNREVKLLEHQQTKRLNGPQTNTVPTVTVP